MKFKNVLISVSDKTELLELASKLSQDGARIVSTDGTANYLKKNSINAIPVSEQTGFPEVMDGRVRTLHPHIHIPLLARHFNEKDQLLLKEKNLPAFDLLICNLYPFEENIGEERSFRQLSEHVDIGGVALLRAAAKNFESLLVICNPEDYNLLFNKDEFSLEERKYFSAKAFHHVSSYDALIAKTLAPQEIFPQMGTSGQHHSFLRYGENPIQKGYWFKYRGENWGLHQAEVLQGKPLSYNNILDISAAVKTLRIFNDETTVVSLKHNNPCGIATDSDPIKAVNMSLSADPVSVFGGIVALNSPITSAIAERLTSIFLECVIAPEAEPDAKKILQEKKKLRVLIWKQMCEKRPSIMSTKDILGGYVLQSEDQISPWSKKWQVLGQAPSEKICKAITFAWKTVACLKSNAIAITSEKQTLGLGIGQTNRIDAVCHAISRWRSHHPNKKQDIILASDAFFPFTDAIEKAFKEKIQWIVQPGGSIKDHHIIQKAKELKINMVLTGQRHFLH